jgi:hypothetical protein
LSFRGTAVGGTPIVCGGGGVGAGGVGATRGTAVPLTDAGRPVTGGWRIGATDGALFCTTNGIVCDET